MAGGGLLLALDVLLHVILLMTILTVFFLVYASHLEENTFRREIRRDIGPLIDQALTALSPAEGEALRRSMGAIDLEALKTLEARPSRAVRVNNQWLTVVMIGIIVALTLVFGALVIASRIMCGLRPPLGALFTETAILFVIVGVIEIFFFLQIAARYAPVRPSVMIKTFHDTLQRTVRCRATEQKI